MLVLEKVHDWLLDSRRGSVNACLDQVCQIENLILCRWVTTIPMDMKMDIEINIAPISKIEVTKTSPSIPSALCLHSSSQPQFKPSKPAITQQFSYSYSQSQSQSQNDKGPERMKNHESEDPYDESGLF